VTDVVRIINPNSNRAVTAAMSEALAPLRSADGPALECVTLDGAPAGIESQADVATVEPMIRDWVVSDHQAAAFVLGCYSDPALYLCREATARPVFGIQECAALLAVSRGGRFGVISILDTSIERHWRHLRMLGLAEHCVGDRAIGMTVGGEGTLARLIEVGTRLRDEDRARCVILGCAGMARHREPLEEALGIPVIEPTQAATSVAIGAVRLGW
jgi:Asp/Glu/hydantoin racemase